MSAHVKALDPQREEILHYHRLELFKVFPQVVLLLLPRKSPEVGHHNHDEGRVTSARYKDMKPSKANFDNILLHMDSTVVGVWLKRANDSVKSLASWPYDGR